MVLSPPSLTDVKGKGGVMAVLWTKEQGQEGIVRACASMKVGLKRGVYNALDLIKSDVEARFSNIIAGHVGMEDAIRAESQVEQALTNAMAKVQGIHLLQDTDIMRQAALKFEQITLDGNVYAGHMGQLQITWKGSTYSIGDMVITYVKGPYTGMPYERIRVQNTAKPREATVPHPHVNSDGKVCFGTWKEMMGQYAKEHWNWLRIMVMVAEFLTHYTPEGTPYQKLCLGWQRRHVSGPRRCKECERADSDCTCIREGTPCPKTGDILAQIPDANYCIGCARWATPNMLGAAGVPTSNAMRRIGACAGTASADQYIQVLRNEWRQTQWEVEQVQGTTTPHATPRRRTSTPRLSYDRLPLHYRRSYVFATDHLSRTVYRCRRPVIDMTGPAGTEATIVRNEDVMDLRVLRILPSVSAEAVRAAGLIEFSIRLRAGMLGEVQSVINNVPSFEHTGVSEATAQTAEPAWPSALNVAELTAAVERLREVQRRDAEAELERNVERNNETQGGSSEVGNQQS